MKHPELKSTPQHQYDQRPMSESEYSGDEKQDKKSINDDVSDAIRQKYPHLFKGKVRGLAVTE